MSDYKRVFDIDPDLEIIDELLSIHAMNPFIPENSSARGYMSSSHLSQNIVPNDGDEKIIQSGLEKQFGENTWSKKLDCDAAILSVIKRYDGIGINNVNADTEYIIVYENLDTAEVDYIQVPYNFNLNQQFGFKYKWNTDLIDNLNRNVVLDKGTILADSPSVRENNGHAYGFNLNVAMLTLPCVDEDAVTISRSLSEKTYKTFEKVSASYGSETFPLNIYGDEKEYKAFPEIGEYINEDSVLMVLRDYDVELAPALLSVNDVTNFDPIFDKAVYVEKPGGKIVDIKCYYTPKNKKEVYTGTSNQIQKYINGMEKYHKDIISVYEKLTKDHYAKFGNNDLKISNKLHNLVLDAYAVLNKDNRKIKYTYKKEELDIYRLEFTIEYTNKITIGSKITDGHGSKGIVTRIEEDESMPCDPISGVRSDIIMDPNSTISRMNMGRPYEQYFNHLSRHTKRLCITELKKYIKLNTNVEVYEAPDIAVTKTFDIMLGLFKIIDTEQYIGYSKITSIDDKISLIYEMLEEELYIYYKVSSRKKPYQIFMDIKGTIYEYKKNKILIEVNGEMIETLDDIVIAPLYMFLLAKTANDFLSTASARTNHYGVPIGSSKAAASRLPWRNSPVKNISETEGRLYGAYGSRLALAELKDRANSHETHKAGYRNILNAEYPTNMDNFVDRNKVPFGNDVAMNIINNILNSSGIEIGYERDMK